LAGNFPRRLNQQQNQYQLMKLFLSALCASLIVSPLAFAGKCEKKECDKEKKEETILADCGKCKKDGDKDKEKEEGTILADCGKCKKDGDKEKEEGTLAGKCKKECDEDKEEGTLLAGKCKKECDEDKEEGTLLA
jgi:hypothetical protein